MRIVIVGGVAGGAAVAARMRRLNEDLEIVMCERGKHVSFANVCHNNIMITSSVDCRTSSVTSSNQTALLH